METWIIAALPATMAGFERNTTIEGRQQDLCSNVAGNGVTGDCDPALELWRVPSDTR